jgi:hypothetical protein
MSLWRDRQLWLVLAVALAVRAGLLASAFWTGASLEVVDSGSYERPAQSFLAAGTFSQDQSPPYAIDLVRTPGYPFFLAGVWRVCGAGNIGAVVAAQLALALVAVALVYATARRVAGRRGALVAGLLLAVSGLSAALPFYILSDALFQFSVALWLFLLVCYVGKRSWGNLLAVSVVAGLVIYVRPVGLLLPAVVPVVALARQRFFINRGRITSLNPSPGSEGPLSPKGEGINGGGFGRRIGQAAVALLVPALILFPLLLRNHLGGDTWSPTIIASEAMLRWRAPLVMHMVEGKEFYTEARGEMSARAAARTPPGATPGERSRINMSVATEYLAAHPWATARAYADGAVALMLVPERWPLPHLLGVDEEGHVFYSRGGWLEKIRTVLGQYRVATLVYMAWETAWMVLVWLMALVGWLRLRRWGQVAASNALGLVMLCLLATSLAPESMSRYLAPLMVPLVVLAGAMWLHSTGRVEDRAVRGPI